MYLQQFRENARMIPIRRNRIRRLEIRHVKFITRTIRVRNLDEHLCFVTIGGNMPGSPCRAYKRFVVSPILLNNVGKHSSFVAVGINALGCVKEGGANVASEILRIDSN